MLLTSPDVVRRVCAAFGGDARTYRQYLQNPQSVREASRLRIERALTELGLQPPRVTPFDGAPQPLGITSLGYNGRPR